MRETIIRVFDYCPKCKEYISPGFRTDMCPFCKHDFIQYPEYQRRLEEDINSLGEIAKQKKIKSI